MKQHIVLSAILFSLGLVCSCGGGSTKVGTGANFSTIDPQPTDVEFASAFFDAFEDIEFLNFISFDGKLALPARLATRFLQTVGQTTTQQSTTACPGGGEVNSVLTVKAASQTTGTIKVDSSFEDCGMTMSLPGGPYVESMNGSTTLNMTINSNTLSYSNDMGLSVSGGLGFAADCDLSDSISESDFSSGNFSNTQNGTCTFRDAADQIFEVSGSELLEQ